MSLTIETINNKINGKFKGILELIESLEEEFLGNVGQKHNGPSQQQAHPADLEERKRPNEPSGDEEDLEELFNNILNIDREPPSRHVRQYTAHRSCQGDAAMAAAQVAKRRDKGGEIIDREMAKIMSIKRKVLEKSKEYSLDTASTLAKYYASDNSDQSIHGEYCNIIDGNNIIEDLDNFLKDLQSAIAKIRPYLAKKNAISVSVHNIKKNNINLDLDNRMANKCECGGNIEFSLDNNDMKCQMCNMIYAVDLCDYNSTGDNIKIENDRKNNYKHEGYFAQWIEAIQGKAKKIYQGDDMHKIREYARRNYSGLNITNIYQIRKILKDTNMTKYNREGPAVYILLDPKHELPEFSSEQASRMVYWYKIVKDYWTQIHNKNASQYSYFLFKFEQLLFYEAKKAGRHKRAQEIKKSMRFTYLPSQDTIIKNDKMYKKVCDKIYDDEISGKIEKTDLYYIETDLDRYLYG